MSLENWKNEFPRMPEQMRRMVEEEVARQIAAEDTEGRMGAKAPGKEEGQMRMDDRKKNGTYRAAGARKRNVRRMVVAVAAAVAVLGTTVFGGVKLYQELRSEKVGSYGLKTGIVSVEGEKETGNKSGADEGQRVTEVLAGADEQQKQAPEEVPMLTLAFDYVPEGMKEAYGTQLYFEGHEFEGGISTALDVMGEDGNPGEFNDFDVTDSEKLEIAGHSAVYLERQLLSGGYNKKMYVVYPEFWQVLTIYASEEMTKEEIVKVAEGIRLEPTGETKKLSECYTLSDMETEQTLVDPVPMSATKEEMGQTHSIGDAFDLSAWAEDAQGNPVDGASLSAKVTSVQVADDLSLLGDDIDTDRVESSWKEAQGEDGKLLPDEVQYIKSGDGVNTLDTVIKTEEVEQKLVYVTAEYTNTGEEELFNVLFNGTFHAIVEKDGTYTMFNRANLYGADQGDAQWDRTMALGASNLGGMRYYDVHGNERGNNYIPSIKPGETMTVHMANIVHEDELPYLYLNLDPLIGDIGFDERSLATGYVDIRQK